MQPHPNPTETLHPWHVHAILILLKTPFGHLELQCCFPPELLGMGTDVSAVSGWFPSSLHFSLGIIQPHHFALTMSCSAGPTNKGLSGVYPGWQ